MVSKRVGENAILQWIIEKENNTDQIAVADLFFLFGNDSKLLFALNHLGKTDVSKVSVEDRFGKRIEAEIQESKTYLVKIQNLTYKDTSRFELQVRLSRKVVGGEFLSLAKSKIIQLFVGGMEHILFFIFYFPFFTTSK